MQIAPSETNVPIPVQTKTAIAVAHGDGIGPEIMDATLRILDSAGAQLEYHPIEIGEALYNKGFSSGIEPESWNALRKTKVFLKAPITTPQGDGVKSLNVTVRKTLGLYANVRPCVAYAPFVKTNNAGMNVVIIRENEEDLYAGIEHRQTDEVYQCLKLVSRPGCERIVRYAFEYAMSHSRKKVTCMTKDNIMKLTDGLFHRVFDEIGVEYPDIEKEHQIIDIGMARAAKYPERYDVIVTPNLYGDILSDVTAEAAGSVGLAPSANIGEHCAMFEAIHGSAPRLAGQDQANPSGLLLAAVMMMVHVGQPKTAEKVHNAWLRTIEEGYHTKDLYVEGQSKKKVGTAEFADQVIAHLGLEPQHFEPVRYEMSRPMKLKSEALPKWPEHKQLVGVDIFIAWKEPAAELARKLDGLPLQMITNRGVKVWPNGFPETFLVDHFRCRFMPQAGTGFTHADVISLLERINAANVEVIKTENLYTFNGQPGFSLGQGQ